METGLHTVQQAAGTLLNLAAAVVMGATFARLWLTGGDSGWAAVRRERVRKAALLGALLAIAADLAVLWLESAAMADVAVTQAGAAAWTMLTATHFGVAWSIGLAGLAASTAAAFMRAGPHPAPAGLSLAGLAVFWYTRAMVSHAAGDGDLGLRILADWVHLNLMGLWVGEVLIAAAIGLRPMHAMAPADRQARAAYLRALSNSATVALAGIFVTGLYAAWRNLGGWGDLGANAYGKLLVAKVSLAGTAAALGGFNRFFVMPPWLASESSGAAAPARLPARFRRVLRIEAAILLGIVVLAAWLASTPPPGEPG